MIVEDIVFQIGVTLLVSMLLGALFAKFKQSEIVGYLLGGILLGPYVLGFIKQTDTDVLSLFSELGVLLLLFFIGLELDLRKFKGGGLYAFVLGPAKIVVCFGLGYLLGGFFGFTGIESILLGLIMSFTSTAIIGKYLMDNHLMNSLEANIAIPMLLIEDFVAVIALALLSVVGERGAFDAVVLNSVFFMIFAIFVIGRFSGYLIRIMEKLDYERHITLYSLGIALAMAFLAAYFKLSPAIGAFLGGFLLAGLGHAEKIKKELSVFRDFFAAFFFVGIGLHFVPTSWSVILIGSVILIVYIFGQIFAYGLFGALLGLRSHFNVHLANLMIAIGEFSLIIAGVAVSLGTPHAQEILGIAIFLGITSTFVMTILVKHSEGIADALHFLVPSFVELPFKKIRIKTHKLIQVPLKSSYVQNEVFEHLKKIALNIFIILSIWYVFAYIIIESHISLRVSSLNSLLFSVLGLLFALKPLISLFKEMRRMIFTIVKVTSRDVFHKYGFNQLIRIEEAISEIFMSFFVFVLSLVLFFIARYVAFVFNIAAVIVFLLSLFLFVNGVLILRRERLLVKKGILTSSQDIF